VVAGGTGSDMSDGVTSEPSPEQQTETNEMREHIRSALTRIEEPYRSIVILREIQEMKYDEIAKSLELPLNTVKSYLYRGRRMLRNQLKETLSHGRV
jgi:RNA polymerase sigma-70 factor (ECF subfamily)